MEIASAYISILPSMKGAKGVLTKEVMSEANSAGKKSGLLFGKAFAAGGALLATAGVGSVLRDSLGEAREAQKVGALTESIIKSTGGAAKISADQIGALAGAISAKTGMDDEAIQSGANLLLTFKNVKREGAGLNDIFGRATAAAADLSAAGFGDLNGQAKMLGKALNDPIKGISALSRSGVTFSEAQKKQIKAMVTSGQTLKAQKIILREVESQVGGAAAATATAGDKAAVAMGNLKEQVGTALLPVVDRLASTFTSFVSGMQSGTGAGGALASVLGTVGRNFGTIAPVLGVVAAGLGAYKVAMLASAAASAIQAAGTTGATGATWSLNAALRANPIGLVVTALTAMGVGLVLAYKKSETFRNIVNGALKVVKVAAGAVVNFFTTKVPAAFNRVKSAASSAIGWVKGNWPKILAVLTGPFGIATLMIVRNWDRIKAGGVAVLAWIKGLPGRIKGAFSNAASLLLGVGKDIVAGLKNGITNAAGDAVQAAKDMAGKVKDAVTGFFKVESPSRLMASIGVWLPRGLAVGINKGAPAAVKSAKALASAAAKAVGDKSTFRKEVNKHLKWKLGDALVNKKSLASDSKAYAAALNQAVKKALGTAKKQIAAQLKGLGAQIDAFKGLRDAVTSAFAPDLFGATPAEFFGNLRNQLTGNRGVLAAFDKLSKMKLNKGFLSGLISSGNTDLITALAGAGTGVVQTAQRDWLEVQRTAKSLGVRTAESVTGERLNDLVSEQRKTNKLLARLDKAIGQEVAKGVNGSASNGKRNRR